MPNYKISGYAGEACDIRLMRGNTFIGHKSSVPAGAYELVFSLGSIEDIDVVAVRSDGKIIGYGGITPVSTSDSTNITVPTVSGPIKTIQNIYIDRLSDLTNYTFDITLNNEVDMTKTLFMYNPTSVPTRGRMCYVNPLSNTVIQLVRGNVGEGFSGYLTVVEYNSGSVQRGVTSSVNNVNITINSIDLTKSFASISGWSHNLGAAYYPHTINLNSSTNIYMRVSVGILNTSWQVIDFT